MVLFNVAAVVSIRWLATAAHIGPGSLGLWAGAAVFFFVPLALAVAGLNEKFPCEGGIYTWTGISFGQWHGFLCGWCAPGLALLPARPGYGRAGITQRRRIHSAAVTASV